MNLTWVHLSFLTLSLLILCGPSAGKKATETAGPEVTEILHDREYYKLHHTTPSPGPVGTLASRFTQNFQPKRAITLGIIILLSLFGPIIGIQLLSARAKRLHTLSVELSKKGKEADEKSNPALSVDPSESFQLPVMNHPKMGPVAGPVGYEVQLAVKSKSDSGRHGGQGLLAVGSTGSSGPVLKQRTTKSNVGSIGPKILSSHESKSQKIKSSLVKSTSSGGSGMPTSLLAAGSLGSTSLKATDSFGGGPPPKTKSFPIQPVTSVNIESQDLVLNLDQMISGPEEQQVASGAATAGLITTAAAPKVVAPPGPKPSSSASVYKSTIDAANVVNNVPTANKIQEYPSK